MKRLFIVLAVALVLGMMASPVIAVTPEDIEASCEEGVAWLVSVQDPTTGAWGMDWQISDQFGTTGLVLVKLEERAFELGYNGPFDDAYPYKQNVEDGLDYLFNYAATVPITGQNAGDPDSDGDGLGISVNGRIYDSGILMMAIAAGRDPSREVATGPLATRTYGDVLQDMADWMAYAQADIGDGRGGWFYYAQDGGSTADQSNSGYAILGLLYATSPSYGYESTVPPFVATELDFWIDYIQNDIDEDVNGFDGGAAYYPGYGPDYWVNSLKTGNLLTQMTFVGDNQADTRVQNALDYIGRHWNEDWVQGWGKTNAVEYQATYCLMKGFETMDIPLDGVPGVADWYQDMATEILAEQDPEEHFWPSSPAYIGPAPGGGPAHFVSPELSTAWALLTLERFAPPPPNQPPDTSGAKSSINCLWPPDHKFVDGQIIGVIDPDGDAVTITVTKITSDEPTATDKGSGGATHAPDATGVGTAMFSVRSECSGKGDGRVYTIFFTADDGNGGVSEGYVTVGVPHDQSKPNKPCQAVDSGQKYDATAIN
jgi:hypothetical protein